MIVSYEISKIIAKLRIARTIEESAMLPFVSVIMSTILKKIPREITNNMPLSNNPVSRRLDEMSTDIQNQLIAQIPVKQFAI